MIITECPDNDILSGYFVPAALATVKNQSSKKQFFWQKLLR